VETHHINLCSLLLTLSLIFSGLANLPSPRLPAMTDLLFSDIVVDNRNHPKPPQGNNQAVKNRHQPLPGGNKWNAQLPCLVIKQEQANCPSFILISNDGCSLICQSLSNILNTLFFRFGFDTALYNTHCFCIEMATTASHIYIYIYYVNASNKNQNLHMLRNPEKTSFKLLLCSCLF